MWYAVIGNSSSGIIEVPVLKRPTVNVGDRQRGTSNGSDQSLMYLKTRDDIIEGIELALSNKFQKIVQESESIYGKGNVSHKIKDVIKSYPLEGILLKIFHDMG